MATKRIPGPICQTFHHTTVLDGTECRSESPVPGPAGVTAARFVLAATTSGVSGDESDGAWNQEVSGSAVPAGVGIGSVVRIPVPDTNGLYIELRPRGWTPKGGTTSTVFIQDGTGKRVLRLDYGPNKNTGRIDYHWNQKGTFAEFGIAGHTPAGNAGEALYQGAKYFKYGGRLLLVVGIAMDVYSIVVAKKRWRQVARVAAGWAGATAGCEIAGAWGAGAGTAVKPGGGTVVGGLLGCAVGGIAGYAGASWAAGEVYDWVEETFFEPLPAVRGPE